MGANPRNFGNLAEVLDFEPSATVKANAQPPHKTPSFFGEGAVAFQARLADRVRAWDEQEHAVPASLPKPVYDMPCEGDEPANAADRAKSGKSVAWRMTKTLVALAAVMMLGWTPMQRMMQSTSAEATVNARLVTLRAPIDGKVTMPAQIAGVGTTIGAGDQLLSITNPRAERTQFDNLRRQISGLEAERDALTRRKVQLEGLQAQMREQRDAFQKGRIEQLKARVAELAAGIAAATAKEHEAGSALERAQRLRKNGYQTQAGLDLAEREHKVAVNAAEALRQRLIGANVELNAARKGLFVGDSYNDIPRTAQRLDEITQQVIELGGQIEERALRISQLQTELSQEEERFALHSTASVTAPVLGRVWEVLTSDGEQVSHGQDLMRVLDCGGVVVTAAVSEAVYNALWLGQPATFHLRGESMEYEGRVIGLNGLAAVPSNLAINKSALAREPYHVTVEAPNLATGLDCHVGRTGKVTFGTAVGGTTAALP